MGATRKLLGTKRVIFAGLLLGLLISGVSVFMKAPPCAFGQAACPVSDTSLFSQNVGLQGGTTFTTTINSVPTANQTWVIPDSTSGNTFVGTSTVQTLSNKTLTSPILTTPEINDTSLDHQYIFAASELAADRIVTLPLLGAGDTFVFEAFIQTLSNKTLTTPQINDTSLDHQYIVAVSELAADRIVTLPLLGAGATFSFVDFAETLSAVKTFSAEPVYQDNIAVALGTGSDARLFYNGTDTFLDLRATGTGDLLVALETGFPSPDPNALHLWAGSAGALTANNSSRVIVEDDSTSVGISILGPNDGVKSIIFGEPASAVRGIFQYFGSTDVPADTFSWSTAAGVRLRMDASSFIFQQAMEVDVQGGYFQLEERVAPGAGPANAVRIYAVVDGGSLTDLAAVFQDGTVDIFAQEVTKPTDAVVAAPDETVGTVVIKRPHPGVVQLVVRVTGWDDWVISEKQFHDAEKVSWVRGAVEPLPEDWDITTSEGRCTRLDEAEWNVLKQECVRVVEGVQAR